MANIVGSVWANGGDASATNVLAASSSFTRGSGIRAGDCVNVLDYGAFGNGTTNYTTQIQNAHAEAASLGKAVYFPPGTYLHSGLAGITQSLVGESRETTKLLLATGVSTSTPSVAVASSASNWCAVGLTLDGQNSDPTVAGTNGSHGIEFITVGSFTTANTDCFIRDCTVQNMGGNGINAQGMINFLVDNVRVLNAPLDGIFLDGCSGARITNNFVSKTGSANISISSTSGLAIYTISDNIVLGNHCEQAGLNSANIADNITGYNVLNTSLIVANNYCDTSINHNIHVGGQNLVVHGNTGKNATQSCLLIYSRDTTNPTPQPARSSFCSIVGNTFLAGSQSAIEIDEFTSIVCNNNICSGNATQGINIIGGIGGTVIGNTCTLNSGAGIRIAASINMTISGNSLTGNANGITMNDSGNFGTVACTGNTITGNTVIGNGAIGIQSTGTNTGNFFADNVVTGQTADIAVTPTDFARGNILSSKVDFFNWVDATAAGVVQLTTSGADTNIPMLLVSKGAASGYVSIRPGGVETLRVTPVAGAVNYFAISAAAAGSDPIIIGQGTSTNIGLVLDTKGAGVITLSAFTADLVTAGISAAGTTQATATVLTSTLNTVTTVGSGSGVALPLNFPVGGQCTVSNRAATNALLVYAPTTPSAAVIEAQGATVGLSVNAGSTAYFYLESANQWRVRVV